MIFKSQKEHDPARIRGGFSVKREREEACQGVSKIGMGEIDGAERYLEAGVLTERNIPGLKGKKR